MKGSCTRIYRFVPHEPVTFPFFEANFVTWNGVWEPWGGLGAGLSQTCVSGAFWELRPGCSRTLLGSVYYDRQKDQPLARPRPQMCNKWRLGHDIGAR